MSQHIKNINFSKKEFIKAISEVKVAESLTGVKYSNICIDEQNITGIRETTGNSFIIKIDSLYDAYEKLNAFNTNSLKPFVYKQQSPAMAILIAINAIKPTISIDKKNNSFSKNFSNDNKISPIQRQYEMRCPKCGIYMTLTPLHDGYKWLSCTSCYNAFKNPNYDSSKRIGFVKKYNSILKILLSTIFIISFICIFAYFDIENNTNVKNGKLQEAAQIEAFTAIKRNLKNSSSFKPGGMYQGIYDQQSESQRYFMVQKFSATNTFGGRIDSEAYIIFDKDGHVTSVTIQ